jgi:hypothetical protein
MIHSSSMASRTLELLDGVRQTQHLLAADFVRHDDRQAQFKKKFAQETRKRNQLICDTACETTAASTSLAALLFAQHDVSDVSDVSGGTAVKTETGSRHEHAASIRAVDPSVLRGLAPFYTPPSDATDLICDCCGGFRGAALVQPLPEPWEEYTYEVTGKRYYFHREERVVRWRPPPESDPLSVLVFERTNSVATVCRCIPSADRRRRLMQKFRDFAMQTAKAEAEKRDQNLRGAFSSLAMSLVANDKR